MNKKEKNLILLTHLENSANNIENSKYISDSFFGKGSKFVDNLLLQRWQEEVQIFICDNFGKNSNYYENFFNHKKSGLITNYYIFEKQYNTFCLIKENYIVSTKNSKNSLNKYFNTENIKSITNNQLILTIINHLFKFLLQKY